MSDGPRCNIFIDDLISTYSLQPDKPCPVCNHRIGFHDQRPASSSVSSPKKGNDGSKSVLPQWGVDYKVVKLFLERFERVLTGDLVDKSHWPRLLLKATPNSHDGYWVNKYIVEAEKDWSEAKQLFADHFESYAYQQKLTLDYERMKQFKDETTQRYTDRFMQLLEQLDFDPDQPLVIQHYLNGLLPSIHANLLRHMESAALMSGKPVTYDTLKKTSDIAIRLEAIELNHGIKALSLNGRNESTERSKNNDTQVIKHCKYHPTATSHSTSECKHPYTHTQGSSTFSSAVPSLPLTSQSHGDKNISSAGSIPLREKKKCFLCGSTEHMANDVRCPKRSSVSTHNNERVNLKLSGNTAVTSSSSSSLSSSSSASATSTSSSATTANVHNKSVSLDTMNVDNKVSSVKSQSDAIDRTISNQVFDYEHRRQVMILLKDCLYNALIDTGASVSFIDTALASRLDLTIVPPASPGSVLLAQAGSSVPRTGTAKAKVIVFFPSTDKPSVTVEHTFEIMALHSRQSDHHFTIGRDLLHRLFPDALPRNYYLPVGYNPQQPELKTVTVTKDDPQPADQLEQPTAVTVATSGELETEFSAERAKLLDNISSLLEVNSSLSGFCNVPEAQVTLSINPDYESRLYRKQYTIAQSLIEPTTKIINRWLSEGKICPAPPGCRYNNPITVVPKRDDSGNVIGVRPCLDVRLLNKALIVGDGFPIPHIREALESFAGNSIFSELDLQEAYLQFPLHPDSRPYTAFTWNRQQYMFVGCPYGLTLLTSHFQRIMTRIFSDLTFCAPYVDNIPFASKDWETHTLYAISIVDRLNKVNLKLKPNFMKLGHSHLKCLGHVVSKDGISIDPIKLDVIKDWPLPTTGKELRSFLGLCSFIRQHVRHFAELTAPFEALYNEAQISPTDELIESFNTLKHAISSSPILKFPDFDKPFHIATDASQTGVGGVLFQPSSPDEHITSFNIVGICSKKLQDHQQRWPAYKKELFGVVYSLRKFHAYVWGRHDVVVHTDHKPLTYIFSSSQLSPALQQWLDVLLDYSFEIKHRDGILNVLPDTLSRMYGCAYAQSPVWGVDCKLPACPIADIIEGGENSICRCCC